MSYRTKPSAVSRARRRTKNEQRSQLRDLARQQAAQAERVGLMPKIADAFKLTKR